MVFYGYVKNVHQKLYDEYVPLTDIVKQLPQVFEHFYANKEHAGFVKNAELWRVGRNPEMFKIDIRTHIFFQRYSRF